MFPHIKHINDLLPFVQGNSQIRIKPCEITGHQVVCYMVQDEDTFAGEHEHYERECRGITFSEDGKIVARTLHKFFNIGQRDDVRPENLQWQNVTRIMDKRDGSMVTPVLVQDNYMMKTKKSFTTKEATLAREIADTTTGGAEFIMWLLSAGMTPTFEITSPQYPIVLKYDKAELTLLHIRENVTGRYLDEREIMDLAPPFPIVENVMSKFFGEGLPQNLVSWKKLEEFALTATGTEGVVIQFDQDMVKLKTQWYCDLHHSVTFTRWRDIARSVVADQSDDLKAAFAMTGRDIAPIVKVERHIAARCRIVENAVEEHVSCGRALNRTPKDMALALREHELFGLIMRVFRDQEVNYMEFYEKHYLESDWGLEVVGDDQ